MSKENVISIRFDEEIFDELYKFIKQNPQSFRRADLLTLAEEAGGGILKSAVDKYSFPPCQGRGCLDCWLHNWCTHLPTPANKRTRLISAEETITTPNSRFSEDIVDFISSLDKTDPEDIQTIFDIVFGEDEYAIYIEEPGTN